jgi:hypothetical protein
VSPLDSARQGEAVVREGQGNGKEKEKGREEGAGGQVCKIFSPFICIYHAIQILPLKGKRRKKLRGGSKVCTLFT